MNYAENSLMKCAPDLELNFEPVLHTSPIDMYVGISKNIILPC